MDNISLFISQYGIYAIILVVFLEYACFPVSSEIILPLSGAVAAACGFGFFPVTLVCSIAGLLGTYLIYMVSFYSAEKLESKLSQSSKQPNTHSCQSGSKNKLAWCNSFLNRWGKYAVCISRVIPLFRTYIAFAAGFYKMPQREYLLWSFLGIAVWNSVLIACGYALGSNPEWLGRYYSRYKYILFGIITIILFIIVLRNIHTRRRNLRKCC